MSESVAGNVHGAVSAHELSEIVADVDAEKARADRRIAAYKAWRVVEPRRRVQISDFLRGFGWKAFVVAADLLEATAPHYDADDTQPDSPKAKRATVPPAEAEVTLATAKKGIPPDQERAVRALAKLAALVADVSTWHELKKAIDVAARITEDVGGPSAVTDEGARPAGISEFAWSGATEAQRGWFRLGLENARQWPAGKDDRAAKLVLERAAKMVEGLNKYDIAGRMRRDRSYSQTDAVTDILPLIAEVIRALPLEAP